MNRKITAVLLIVCMLTGLLSALGVSAEQSAFYRLIATDSLDHDSYGVANNTFFQNISNASAFGSGWYGAWSKSATAETMNDQVKLDANGMFIQRPSSSAGVRIYRQLAQTIDFSQEGTYTFTAVLKENNNDQTDYYSVFELGNSGIEFGVDCPTAKSYCYPYIKLPGGTAQKYNGTAYDSMLHKGGTALNVVLEVTARADGNDTLKVKAYREGSTDVGFLKTLTTEISDKTVSYLGLGFNYCADYTKKTGVTRINSVKVEYDNPALSAKIDKAANGADATEQDIIDGFSALTAYTGADKSDLIAAIKANANTLGYPASVYAAEITNMTPDITGGSVSASDFEDVFDIEFSYPLSGVGTLYIKDLSDNVIALSSAVSGKKVTMIKTGEFEFGERYVLTTDDMTDFKDDLLPIVEFATVVVPTVNVENNASYDIEKTIIWDDETMEVTAKLLYPGSYAYTPIDNNIRLTQAGSYKLVITASFNGLTNDTTFNFTILPDIKPVAQDVTIALAEGSDVLETGAVLKGSFTFYDENSTDSLKEAYYVWYRTDGITRTKIGEGEEYTLTEADENHNIILEVTPISNSSVNPEGDPAESAPFKGAYAPVGENLVVDDSAITLGSVIKPEFDYFDENGDAEGKHIVKWYKYGDSVNAEITENVGEDGELEITADLIGEYIYAVVTPVSVHKPYNGNSLTSGDIEIKLADSFESEEESDFALFEKVLFTDNIGKYGLTVNNGADKADIPEAAYADNSTGFSHNWSKQLGSYVAPSGGSVWFQKVAGTWGLSWRGPDPIYRALSQPVDMSQNGTYVFEAEVLEYAHGNADNNLTGSDFRMYLGGTSMYFGYTDAGTTAVLPQVKVPGAEKAVKGDAVTVSTASDSIMIMHAEIVVTDADDTFRLKIWEKGKTEPEQWSVEETFEIGSYTLGYAGFTPNPILNNGCRYLSLSGGYENTELKEKISSVTDSATPTESELREAFAAMSTYPEGSEKNVIITQLKAKAAGTDAASAVIKEASVSETEPVVANEVEVIEIKYDYMLDPDSVFVLKDTDGNTVQTSCTTNENKVIITITQELEIGTEYTVDSTGATDYKGDVIPDITFKTYATPEINITDDGVYSDQYVITWEETPASVVTLQTPSNETSVISSGYVLTELGNYTLVLTSDDTRTIEFEVIGDVAPTAENIRIRGLHETGATLTGTYKYYDANGDAEGETVTQWYRVANGNKIPVGTTNSATYILTPSDENCNIVFGVTAKSVSGSNRTGEEVFSGEFMGGYAPVAENVKITGDVQLGETLSVEYTYYDKNNDFENNSQVKWYFEGGSEITQNTGYNTLLITEKLFESKIFAEVTPVSVKAPFVGKTVRTEKTLMPCKPVISNVSISGVASAGNTLMVNYDFSDANFDQQGESKFEWKNAATGTVIGRGRALEVTTNMAGTSITVTVTGVSEKAPYESTPVTSAAVSVSSYSVGGTGGGAGGGSFVVSGSMSGSGGGGSAGGAPVTPQVPQTPVEKTVFGDVYGHWAEEYVTVLLEKGVVMEDESFRPDDSISRAELLAMLFRSAGISLSKYADSFDDVNKEDWFADYVQTALDMGIISEADRFRPNDAVTREESAKIVANMLELESDAMAEFADSGKISEWAVEFVNAVYKAGIFKGDENGNFNPKGNLTRAETATVIYRLIEAGSFNAGGAV